MSELQFLKTLVKNAGSYLKFFSVIIIKGSTILFNIQSLRDGNAELCRLTHILKCMLENDVFVNAKPNKINKENKEIKVQKNIKKISA